MGFINSVEKGGTFYFVGICKIGHDTLKNVYIHNIMRAWRCFISSAISMGINKIRTKLSNVLLWTIKIFSMVTSSVPVHYVWSLCHILNSAEQTNFLKKKKF